MSNATLSPMTVRPQLIETMEQARCIRCDAAIPREFVFRNLYLSRGIEPTRRTIRAYCAHDDTVMELVQMLRGGVWVDEGAAVIVTDERRRKGTLARVAHVRGDVQQAIDS